jgi:uncharacterized glyoxalase superfamily protein PhnB
MIDWLCAVFGFEKHVVFEDNQGADIVMEICDQEHGGRGFSCVGPEGYLWSAGSYNPWAN